MNKFLSIKTFWPLSIFLVLISLLGSALWFKFQPESISKSFKNTFNTSASAIPKRSFQLSSVLDPTRQVTQEIFKNKVTVLNVWASWCGPCRAEMDDLMLLSKYPGVQWVGLNLNDELSEAQKILLIYGNPYHETIYDQDGKLAINLGVRGTPEIFILDKQGRVQYRRSGCINETLWKEELWPIIQSLQEE